jgi:hypothetical protein
MASSWSFNSPVFGYRFVDYAVPATCRSGAAARLRADWPSGNTPTTRVRAPPAPLRCLSLRLDRGTARARRARVSWRSRGANLRGVPLLERARTPVSPTARRASGFGADGSLGSNTHAIDHGVPDPKKTSEARCRPKAGRTLTWLWAQWLRMGGRWASGGTLDERAGPWPAGPSSHCALS